MAQRDLPKVEARVRFPYPAPVLTAAVAGRALPADNMFFLKRFNNLNWKVHLIHFDNLRLYVFILFFKHNISFVKEPIAIFVFL